MRTLCFERHFAKHEEILFQSECSVYIVEKIEKPSCLTRKLCTLFVWEMVLKHDIICGLISV